MSDCLQGDGILMQSSKKTLLVGLDAACWEYLDPLLEANQMPTLRGLMNSGMWGTMHSTMPPWTPTAWASIATGKNPGKHGVFDMLQRQPGSYAFTPTNATERMGTPFWKRLNEHELRTGLVNVPFTYPPDHVDGFVVCGFGTPGSVPDVTYPNDILAWITNEFGPYQPAVDAKFLRTAPPSEILDLETKHQSRQVQIALGLTERYSVDVLIINLMLTDHANHKMPDMAQIYEAYRRADTDLNNLIEGFRPDNVMLFSDHGSNRLKGNFLLNAWLRDRGYYVQAENVPAERSAALNWVLVQWLQVHQGWSGPQEKVVRRLARDGLLRLPDRIKQQFWDKVETSVPFARDHVLLSDQPDYTRTPVFPGSVYSGLLYFNLIDREPTGVIQPEERNELASKIASELRQVEEPKTGVPLFSNVYTAKDLYTGPATQHAPDLIIDGYDGGWGIQASKYVPTSESTSDRYFVQIGNHRDFGWHSRDGIFLFSGQDFQARQATRSGHVMDIPATLLHLYGVPIPEDYDGRVLAETMIPELCQQPIVHQSGDDEATRPGDHAYSAEEAEELVNHLRALGYLD